MNAYTERWLMAFGKTQVIEVGLGLVILTLLARRLDRTLPRLSLLALLLFAASAMTHPPLWFVLPKLRKSWGWSYQEYVTFGELGVWVIEGLWYGLTLKLVRARLFFGLCLSLTLNSASYWLGSYLRLMS